MEGEISEKQIVESFEKEVAPSPAKIFASMNKTTIIILAFCAFVYLYLSSTGADDFWRIVTVLVAFVVLATNLKDVVKQGPITARDAQVIVYNYLKETQQSEFNYSNLKGEIEISGEIVNREEDGEEKYYELAAVIHCQDGLTKKYKGAVYLDGRIKHVKRIGTSFTGKEAKDKITVFLPDYLEPKGKRKTRIRDIFRLSGANE